MKRVFQREVVFLFGFLLAASAGYSQYSTILAPAEVVTINNLAKFIDEKPDLEGLNQLRKGTLNADIIIRCLSAALLYKHGDPDSEKTVLDSFAVNDYAQRIKGIYNMIREGEMEPILKGFDSGAAGLKDRRLDLLVGFTIMKEKNKWFKDNSGQLISLARVLRGAFFAAVFKDTGIDPVKIALKIDKETQKLLKK